MCLEGKDFAVAVVKLTKKGTIKLPIPEIFPEIKP